MVRVYHFVLSIPLQPLNYISLFINISNLKNRYEKMDNVIDTNRKKLFWVLILLEVALGIIYVLAGQLQMGLISVLFRVILLLAANYCVQSGYALFYSMMAIFSGLSLIDPIGLYLTGHGYKKTSVQNILCIVALLFTIVMAYIGYLFFKELLREQQQPSVNIQNNDNYSYFGNNNQDNSYSYGGTNYLYQNPAGEATRNTRAATNQAASNNWQPFSGQGHSIG